MTYIPISGLNYIIIFPRRWENSAILERSLKILFIREGKIYSYLFERICEHNE